MRAVIAAPIGNVVNFTNWAPLDAYSQTVFNNVTGIYTTPESGDYVIQLVANYMTNTTMPYDEADVPNTPYVELYDVDTDESLIASVLTGVVINVVVPPPSSGLPPTIISAGSLTNAGQVRISVMIPLTMGQRVRIRAVSNGFTYDGLFPNPHINFNPSPNLDTTLTIFKVRNSAVQILM